VDPVREVRRQAASLRSDAAATRARARFLRHHAHELTGTTIRTLLETEPHRPTAPEVFTFRAGTFPSAIALARRRLMRWLHDRDVDPETAADVTLACSEACANAVKHPLQPSRYAFEVEGLATSEWIELTVRSFGSWRPGTADDNGGRGLDMIRRLMDVVEIIADRGETKIVMRRLRRHDARAQGSRERATGLEPATSSLEGWRSTN
jgi:anti-sigma regulatory factor (Ser/Thr protein kinase)